MAVLFTKDGLQKCRCLARGLCFRSIPWRNSRGRVLSQEVLHCRGARHFGSNSRFENPGSARATCPSNKCFGRSGGPGQCDQIRVDCAGRPLMPEKRPPSMSDAVHCGLIELFENPSYMNWWWGLLPILTMDENTWNLPAIKWKIQSLALCLLVLDWGWGTMWFSEPPAGIHLLGG